MCVYHCEYTFNLQLIDIFAEPHSSVSCWGWWHSSSWVAPSSSKTAVSPPAASYIPSALPTLSTLVATAGLVLAFCGQRLCSGLLCKKGGGEVDV